MRGLSESIALANADISKTIKNISLGGASGAQSVVVGEKYNSWMVADKPYLSSSHNLSVECVCTACNETRLIIFVSELVSLKRDRCSKCSRIKRRGESYRK